MSGGSKKWLIATGIVLIVVVAGSFFIDHWAENKLETLLRQNVEAPDRIGYAQLEVQVLRRKITVKEPDLEWRLKWQARQISLKAAGIEITGICWWPLLFSDRVAIGGVTLEAPTITLSGTARQDSVKGTDTHNTQNSRKVNIDRVRIRDGRFRFMKNPEDTSAFFRVGSFETRLENLRLSPDDNEPLQLDDASASLRDLHFKSEKKLHDITLREVHISGKDSLLQLTELRVKPRFGKRAFARQVRLKTTRLDIDFPEASLQGWNLESSLRGHLVARTARLDSFRLHIYEDLNLPLDSSASKRFPQESLRQASLGIRIDSVLARGGRIRYEERGKDKDTTGSLVFEPVDAVLTNLTNDSARIGERPLLEARLSGLLMKKHRVENRFWFDLASADHAFTFEGEATGLPFRTFNPFFRPAYHLAFESGTIRRIEFRANANNRVSNGSLDLQYENLEFTLLKSPEDKAKLLTGIIDLLFVKEENESQSDDYRPGDIKLYRRSYRSFYWFWWNSIQSGIVTTVLSGVALEKVQKAQQPEK